MFKQINFALSLFITILLVNVLNHRFGAIPPLGPLLSPFEGVWVQAERDWHLWKRHGPLELPELTGTVSIQFDQDHVPHLFAESAGDLYFAQGWATAKDRLWEMDFSARVGLGRLSEVVGARTLPMDRMFVRLQLQESALKSWEAMQQDPVTREAMERYTEGVNAYIRSLSKAELPVEFKILDYRPETWTPLKSVILAKLMAFRLSGMSSDLKLSRTATRLSPTQIDDLFPYFPFQNTPIIPETVTWQGHAIKPKPPAKIYQPTNEELSLEQPSGLPKSNSGDGSNSWAVMGTKTKSGFPILANDTHLGYALPSMWYQIQLSAPQMNVYGVSIAGIPGVIIGFNSHVAWSVTNGYADVMDWYAIQFKDESRNEYWYNNQWVRTHKTSHLIRVRGQSPIEETIVSTHHGPVVYDVGGEPMLAGEHGPGLALRWIGHEATNEMATFLLLNNAQTVEQCWAALEKYGSPQQNFTCADQSKQLALIQGGKVPVKWKGQGRLIGDGRDPAYDWQGWLPLSDWPQMRNPERGFLYSANQNPVGESYPYYLGWDYPSPWRAARIHQSLAGRTELTMDDLARMQQDDLDLQAQMVLPSLIKAIQVERLSTRERELLKLFDDWNFHFTPDSVAATLYTEWWQQLGASIWSKRIGPESVYAWPRDTRLTELVAKTPTSSWFDDPATPAHETLSDWAPLAFKKAIEHLDELHGVDFEKWRWGVSRSTTFRHLGRIPGFEVVTPPLGGNANSLNANKGEQGPVWRMVVELGPEVHGKGIFPGGQSGNPGSRYYDDFMKDWYEGRLREFTFLKARVNNDERVVDRIEMVKE